MEGSNGVTQITYPQTKDNLEDFSQRAINRGQQQINYLITEALEEIVNALNDVKYVVAQLNGNGQVALGKLEQAIDKVSEATNKVASIYPPGCGTASE